MTDSVITFRQRPYLSSVTTNMVPQAAAGYSSEAQQFFDRIADPGTTRKNHYATLIDGLVADSVWTRIQVLMIYAADIEANALINLKSSSHASINVSSTAFTADRGFTGDASADYLETNYVPSVAATQNDHALGAYILNNRTTAAFKWIMGTQTGGADGCGIAPLWVGDVILSQINSTNNDTIAETTARGMTIASRTGAGATEMFRNGVSVQTGTDASTGLSTFEYFVLGMDADGGVSQATDDEVAAIVIGLGMNPTQAAAVSARINTYMTALGINVY
jgi:hypothetical protein